MNIGIFALLWQTIVVLINNGTAQVSTALMNYVQGPFQYCVISYLVIILIIACWSSDEAAFQQYFKQIWLAVIIYSISTQAGAFQYYVSGLVNGITTAINLKLSGLYGGTAGVTAANFDVAMVKAFAAGLQAFKSLSFSPKSWALAITIPLYWLLTALSLFEIFFVWVSSIIVTNFVTAFGPLFIALFFFPFTRMFFDGWIRCVVAGMLTQIFTLGWLAIFLTNLNMILLHIQMASLPTGNGANDIATQILGMVEAGAMVVIFAAMVSLCALLAVRISGGAHAQVGSIKTPFFSSQTNTHHPTDPGARGGGTSGGSNSGNGGDAGPSGSANQNRQYAHNRHVGSAP